MDAATKKQLGAVRDRTPRYLFRCWSNNELSGRVSGGHAGANTPEAITPLAFLRDHGDATVWDITTDVFTRMAVAHVCGATTDETQFSSWAASPWAGINAAGFQQTEQSHVNLCDHVHVSIIDTKALRDTNPIFHVPGLGFLPPELHYAEEYLAWGRISGFAHRSVPLRKFIAAGIDVNERPGIYNLRGPQSPKITEISTQCVTNARRAAEAWGEPLILPMLLAILSIKHRDAQFYREGVPELDTILPGISGLEIPEAWSSDKTIQTDQVYTEGFGEIEQMVHLMRALSRHRDLAKRSTQRRWADVAQAAQKESEQDDHTARRWKRFRISNS